MSTARSHDFFRLRDPERVRRALHALDGGTLIGTLDEQLGLALQGSSDATREYVCSYRALAVLLLDEAHRLHPDVVVRGPDGSVMLVDAKGYRTRAPLGALETASAEAPFGPWTGRYGVADAVALDLTSRIRQLIGLRGLDVPAARLNIPTDDVAAQRFLRRVRDLLNHPDTEHPLRRAADAFGLSKTELAGLFGVRRQAVDQWLERGVPAEREDKLQTLVGLAELLDRKLKRGRLPAVARRPAEAYGGKTMLELIAEDRHRELLEQVRDSFDWASAA